MKEIRIHGRGGQGAVTCSQALALAAFFDGKFSQAFPNFGVERRGAPVSSFCRISGSSINIRSHVYKPDYVIVLDPTLLEAVDVAKGVHGGKIIVNTNRKPGKLNLKGDFDLQAVDVTKIALKEAKKPFVNLGILGAFASFTNEISLDALEKTVMDIFYGKESWGEKNYSIVKKVFESCEAKRIEALNWRGNLQAGVFGWKQDRKLENLQAGY